MHASLGHRRPRPQCRDSCRRRRSRRCPPAVADRHSFGQAKVARQVARGRRVEPGDHIGLGQPHPGVVPRPWPWYTSAVSDPQHRHGLRIVVDAIQHAVRAAAGAHRAGQLPTQRLADPVRIGGGVAEDELDDRGDDTGGTRRRSRRAVPESTTRWLTDRASARRTRRGPAPRRTPGPRRRRRPPRPATRGCRTGTAKTTSLAATPTRPRRSAPPRAAHSW